MKCYFALGLFAVGAVSNACCPLTDPERRPSFLKAEKIVIQYDEASKIEHFVRQVTFDGQNRVGFIVPSPSRPSIATADEKVFDVAASAADAALAKFASSKQYDSAAAEAPPMGGVEVVERLKVGKFDVSIVKAKDRDGLVVWLKARKFGMPDGFEAWIEPYIKQDMFLAVYEFSGGEKGGLMTETIRTTFQTDKPLYPYRIPRQLVSKEYSEFRCYYIARQAAKVAGSEEEFDTGAPEVRISFPLDEGSAKQIFDGFRYEGKVQPDGWVMTEFRSNRASHTDQDLYFDADPNPSGATLVKSPNGSPVLLAGICAAMGGIGLALIQRRRRSLTY